MNRSQQALTATEEDCLVKLVPTGFGCEFKPQHTPLQHQYLQAIEAGASDGLPQHTAFRRFAEETQIGRVVNNEADRAITQGDWDHSV